MSEVDIAQRRAVALDFYNRANLAAAEVVCQDILRSAPDDAAALHLLGQIATRVSQPEIARAYLQRALAADPRRKGVRTDLIALKKMAPAAPVPSKDGRYLLIKSWGYGFWSDVSHVLGALLLAEATGRTPVIHWGRNSRFRDSAGGDAFDKYFEPVSDVSLADLEGRPDAACFPPKWTMRNLREENVNKWQGPFSRAAGLYFLARPEPIAVSDFFVGVVDVAPWLPAAHPMRGKPAIEIYRYLIGKYLRPRPSLVARVETFLSAELGERPFVAAHLRGTDKTVEDSDLETTNQAILAALHTVEADRKIFLLTDDQTWLDRARTAFGARLVASVSQRAAGKTGVHYLDFADRAELAYQVMLDVYVATRAAKFFGNGRSNVAAFVEALGDWKPGECVLISTSQLWERNLLLHLTPRA